MDSRPLRLRPLTEADEPVVREAHRVMAPLGFVFALGLDPEMSWAAYRQRLADDLAGIDLPDHHVPAVFLAADVDGDVVGRISIRLRLNEDLLHRNGHIGYGVLPQHRRRGYATEILRQGLVVARALGVDRVLVTCDQANIGSATVIERCGGRLDPDQPTVLDRETVVSRYWID